MTVSADPCRRGARGALRLAGLGLVGLLSAPVLAQSGAPVPLFPQTPPATMEPAPQDAPAADPANPGADLAPDATDVAPGAVTAPPARSPSGVMVEELRAPDPEMAGTLDAENGGLPADLWAGLPRPELEALLAGIPAGLTSPAMRDITHRLLLTVADPPPGDGAARSLVALRLEALARIGDLAGADALLDRTSRPLEDEAAAQAWVELQYLAGTPETACHRMPDLLGRFNHPVWQKWQMVCQIGAGNPDLALLGIDLLREQGEKDDIFFRLAEAASSGQTAPVKGVATPTPIQLAMILASGRVPQADVKVEGPGPLAALSRVEALPLPLRLAAGERAAALGGLNPTGLDRLYEAVTAPDPKSLTLAAARKATPMLRAQFLRALKAEPSPAGRAGLFKGAMLASSTTQQGGAYGKLLLDQIADFRLTVGFASVAPLVARLHILQGQEESARAWLGLAQEDFNAAKDEGAFARLWPVAAAAGLVKEASFDQGRWVRELGGDNARDLADQVLIILSAVDGVVEPLPPHADGSPATKPKGAVLLDALALLGPEGPAGATAMDIAAIVTDLRRAGLDPAARRLAVEMVAHLLRPV